ncbi:MAG: hypothetical protein M1837_002993 [Sclerophora amabilis]|nr:MAG: hypothetical protein M1837_002993 [Sclerophora amabilis]
MSQYPTRAARREEVDDSEAIAPVGGSDHSHGGSSSDNALEGWETTGEGDLEDEERLDEMEPVGELQQAGDEEGNIGEGYDVPPAPGTDPRDVTSYLPAQRHWSAENLPEILYRLKRNELRDPGYEPSEDWIEPSTNQPRADPMRPGENFKVFRNLPTTLSSRVEGWRLEAWCREDSRIRLSDLRARIQYPSGRKPSVNALQMRKKRFREQFRLQAWNPRNATKWWDDQVEASLTPSQLAANTSRGLRPYTSSEIQVIRGLRKGSCPRRAGKRGKVFPDLQCWRRTARTVMNKNFPSRDFLDNPALRRILRQSTRPGTRELDESAEPRDVSSSRNREQAGKDHAENQSPQPRRANMSFRRREENTSRVRSVGRIDLDNTHPLQLVGATINERGEVQLPSGEVITGGTVGGTSHADEPNTNVFASQNPLSAQHLSWTQRRQRRRNQNNQSSFEHNNTNVFTRPSLAPIRRHKVQSQRHVSQLRHSSERQSADMERDNTTIADNSEFLDFSTLSDSITESQGWVPLHTSENATQAPQFPQTQRPQHFQHSVEHPASRENRLFPLIENTDTPDLVETIQSLEGLPETSRMDEYSGKANPWPTVYQGANEADERSLDPESFDPMRPIEFPPETYEDWLQRVGQTEYNHYVVTHPVEFGVHQWTYIEWRHFMSVRTWRAEQARLFPGDPRFANDLDMRRLPSPSNAARALSVGDFVMPEVTQSQADEAQPHNPYRPSRQEMMHRYRQAPYSFPAQGATATSQSPIAVSNRSLERVENTRPQSSQRASLARQEQRRGIQARAVMMSDINSQESPDTVVTFPEDLPDSVPSPQHLIRSNRLGSVQYWLAEAQRRRDAEMTRREEQRRAEELAENPRRGPRHSHPPPASD